jgi:hypothetical protein
MPVLSNTFQADEEVVTVNLLCCLKPFGNWTYSFSF